MLWLDQALNLELKSGTRLSKSQESLLRYGNQLVMTPVILRSNGQPCSEGRGSDYYISGKMGHSSTVLDIRYLRPHPLTRKVLKGYFFLPDILVTQGKQCWPSSSGLMNSLVSLIPRPPLAPAMAQGRPGNEATLLPLSPSSEVFRAAAWHRSILYFTGTRQHTGPGGKITSRTDLRTKSHHDLHESYVVSVPAVLYHIVQVQHCISALCF